MDLTSLRRAKFALGITKADEDRILSGLIGAASNQIASWTRRVDRAGGNGFELKSRTEYLDPRPGQRRFYPRAYPITSVTSLYGDATGRYAGSESLVASTDYLLDSDSRSVVVQSQTIWPEAGFVTMPRGLRLIYVAGLAAYPTISTWTKSEDVGGTLSAYKYVRGELSGAIGYTTARASGTISIECLGGRFLEGEGIKEYARLDGASMDGGPVGDTGVTATLTACTARCLAEDHPALVTACEMHVQHLRKNRDNFDNLTVNQDGATRFSRSDLKNRYTFLPEVEALIAPYRNNLVTA